MADAPHGVQFVFAFLALYLHLFVTVVHNFPHGVDTCLAFSIRLWNSNVFLI